MVRRRGKRWLALLLAGMLGVSALDTGAFAITAYASEVGMQTEPEGVAFAEEAETASQAGEDEETLSEEAVQTADTWEAAESEGIIDQTNTEEEMQTQEKEAVKVEVLAASSDDEQPLMLYSAVLLTNEEWNRMEAGEDIWQELPDIRWMNADTIGGFFDSDNNEWKALWEDYPNLIIQPNSENGEHDDRERIEQGNVVIPSELKQVCIRNWAMMPFTFKGSITIPDHGTLTLDNCFNGDIFIKAQGTASVVLRRAEIEGELRTDSESCDLTVIGGDSVVGGLKGFRKVSLYNDLYTKGEAEFWDLDVKGDTRRLLVEGNQYDGNKAPVFHNIPEDRVTDRPWILVSREKQQLYEVKNTWTDENGDTQTGESDYYLSVSENGVKKYARVWLEGEGGVTARLDDDPEMLTEDQALERSLANVQNRTVYVSKRYERYEGWNDIDDGQGGNNHRQYEYVKIGEGFYRITASSGWEANESDSEEQKADITLAKEADTDVIAAEKNTMEADLGSGYQLQARYSPSLEIRWIKERSDENDWQWEDLALKKGTQVLLYADSMDDKDKLSASDYYEFRTDYQSDQADADTIQRDKQDDRYLVSIDGRVYYESNMIYGISSVSGNDWNDHMNGDHWINSFDWIGQGYYPTLELAMSALNASGQEYAVMVLGKLDLGDQAFPYEVSVKSLTVPENLKGLNILTLGYRVKDLESIVVPEGKTLMLQKFVAGSSEENDTEAKTVRVTGSGSLVLQSVMMNVNMEVQKTSEDYPLDICLFGEPAIKSLTSECPINFGDDCRLAVEDLFDTSKTTITGRPDITGRSDAVIRLGEIQMIIDSEKQLGVDNMKLTSERKDGKNTMIEFTSSKMMLGKVRDQYGISVSSNEVPGESYDLWYPVWVVVKDIEGQPYEETRYVEIPGEGQNSEYYLIDWDKDIYPQGRPSLETAIADQALVKVDALPEGAVESCWDASIIIRMLDASKEPRFSTVSIYDPQGWAYDPGHRDEQENQWINGDYTKSYDWGGNFVHYTDTSDICLAAVTAEDLPFTADAEDALFNKIAAGYGLIRGEFSSSEANNEESGNWTIQTECMVSHIPETVTEDNEQFYGKQAVRDGLPNAYNMFWWKDGEDIQPQERVQVDTHKYVAALTDLSGADITIAAQTETGSALTPAPTVKLGGETLVKDQDYTVEYKNNVKGGTATVTIKGMAPYGGSVSADFAINHVAGDWVVTKEATQTEKGLRVKKCRFCDEVLQSEEIDKLPADSTQTPTQTPAQTQPGDSGQAAEHTTHTPGEWTVEKEATAKEAGLRVRKCTVCGEILESEVIPKFTVTLNAKSIPLKVKQSTTDVKATVLSGDKVASWKSSNTKVAAVTQKGKITGKKAGKAVITVTTQKGATAKLTVNVQKTTVKVTKVTADVKKLTLKVKKTYKLTVKKTPLTAPDKITFSSNKKKIAAVDKNGKITAKKKGTATITIKCGGKKTTVKVTVKK